MSAWATTGSDVSQATTIRQSERRRRRGGRRGSTPRLHAGRLALLALVLIAAAFYVQPLREFFVQQDRYQQESRALEAARSSNAVLTQRMKALNTKSEIAEQARSDLMLVPDNTMVFVIKGLPEDDTGSAASAATRTESSISVLERLEDLCRTLFN